MRTTIQIFKMIVSIQLDCFLEKQHSMTYYFYQAILLNELEVTHEHLELTPEQDFLRPEMHVIWFW